MELKTKMKTYERFIGLLKPFKKEIGYIYGYALFNGLISLSIPIGMQAIVNFIMMGQLSTSWVLLVIVLSIALILYSIFLILQKSVVESVQQKIFVESAFEFMHRIVRFKKNYIIDTSVSELINRFFDVVAIQKNLSKVLFDFSVNSLQIIVGILLLSFYHPSLLIFSLLAIVILYFITRYIAPKGLESSVEESTYKYELVHLMEETARNMEVYKINTNTELHINKADVILQKYLNHRNKHFNILKTHYISLAILKVIIISGLLIAGSVLVINNKINLGQFIASEILVFMIIISVEKLIYTFDTVYDVLTSIEKVGKIMDLPIEKERIKEKVNLVDSENMRIKFDNVRILINKDTIQRNVNFQFLSGDRIALCGHSGSGKTTLLNVLATLSPAEGNITYNDIALEQLNVQSVREHASFIFSNPKIIEGSFIENIAMSDVKFDIERINKICTILSLNDYIKTFPQNYEAQISIQRNYIPKEIQQKIELARVIYRNPKLVLFDGDLYHLKDSEKKRLIRYFSEELKNAIIVFNTTSLYTVGFCNKLLYLDKTDSFLYHDITTALKNDSIKNLLINDTEPC